MVERLFGICRHGRQTEISSPLYMLTGRQPTRSTLPLYLPRATCFVQFIIGRCTGIFLGSKDTFFEKRLMFWRVLPLLMAGEGKSHDRKRFNSLLDAPSETKKPTERGVCNPYWPVQDCTNMPTNDMVDFPIASTC